MILAALTLMLLAAGCGDNTPAAKIQTPADLGGKVIGMLASSAPPDSIAALLAKDIGAPPKEVVYFNRGADIVAALLAGKIDATAELTFVGDYTVRRNPTLTTIPQGHPTPGSIIMALRKDDLQLRDALDSAIATLQANGTMDSLAKQWINDFPASGEPNVAELPKIAGARTVYVGVAGDYVPLDYIAADGRPAGYNVAFLTAVAQLLQVNFEFVPLDAPARFPALAAKKIDVVFGQFYSEQIAELFNRPNSRFILTKPYYTFGGLCYLVRK